MMRRDRRWRFLRLLCLTCGIGILAAGAGTRGDVVGQSASHAAAQSGAGRGQGQSLVPQAATPPSQRAKLRSLHERLTLFVGVSFGYDSNILDNNGPCVPACASAPAFPSDVASAPAVQQLLHNPFLQTDPVAVTKVFNLPRGQVEWDLPSLLQLEPAVRLLQRPSFSLWTGYRFYQYLLASVAYDHDAYNFQEHALELDLTWSPRRWLQLRPLVEGYVNFSGLRQIRPYQGGLRASLEATFKESARWRTRLSYLNQVRRSFDRTYDTYLDGDRHEAKLQQELSLAHASVRARGQLTYRFRYEQTGVFDTTQPPGLGYPAPFFLPGPIQLGGVDYVQPLSYLGNEVSLRWRLSVPAGVELSAGLSYEYRIYDRAPSAPTFLSRSGVPLFMLPAMPQLRDSLLGLDLGVRKNLPAGFGLELNYSLRYNDATVANWILDPLYTKNAISLGATYEF